MYDIQVFDNYKSLSHSAQINPGNGEMHWLQTELGFRVGMESDGGVDKGRWCFWCRLLLIALVIWQSITDVEKGNLPTVLNKYREVQCHGPSTRCGHICYLLCL